MKTQKLIRDLFIINFLIIAMALLSCSRGGTSPAETCQACPAKKNSSMIGMQVPQMELNAYYKGAITKVKLSELKGKWLILFFYPADFTFVCPTELKELADNYKEFKDAGAEICSVSTDSVFVHRAWHKNNELVKGVQYPMLSDRNGRLSRAMGAYNDQEGTAYRASFLIDPKGIVIAYEFHHDSIGRSADELFRKLNAAVALYDGHGGVCPAGWEPGTELIHPQ